jgi:hypothetical protein
VAALTGLDAESYFTFTLSDEEDSVVLFRWSNPKPKTLNLSPNPDNHAP